MFLVAAAGLVKKLSILVHILALACYIPNNFDIF